MIAVTLGINPLYRALARLSAKCIQDTTDLDTLILTESDFKKSNFSHPAALKLKVFDFIQDDNVLFFDADWFSINKWSPNDYDDKVPIIACHDFILTDDWPEQYTNIDVVENEKYFNDEALLSHRRNTRNDYIEEIEQFMLTTNSFSTWINTGFWIANKYNHTNWLAESLNLYNNSPGHHSQYYEQPAMNKAIYNTNQEVKYLSRKFNTLVATRKKWPNFLIGLHVKIKHNEAFINDVIREKITTLNQVRAHFFSE